MNSRDCDFRLDPAAFAKAVARQTNQQAHPIARRRLNSINKILNL
jgi:hypothetical protein